MCPVRTSQIMGSTNTAGDQDDLEYEQEHSAEKSDHKFGVSNTNDELKLELKLSEDDAKDKLEFKLSADILGRELDTLGIRLKLKLSTDDAKDKLELKLLPQMRWVIVSLTQLVVRTSQSTGRISAGISLQLAPGKS